MKTVLRFGVMYLLLTVAGLAVNVPEKIVRELIAESRDLTVRDVKVAYQFSGEHQTAEGFVIKGAVCVVALISSQKEGTRDFRKVNTIFYRTKKYGWFLSRVEQEGNDELIRIFSEKLGEIEIK